jgi:hypothetical protein
MTQIRSNPVPPPSIYVGAGDVTVMVQALAIDLEQREHDERACERESASHMREARRDEIRSMRRESNAALASGLVQSAAKAAQAVSTLSGGAGDTEGTNRCNAEGTRPPTAEPPGTAEKIADVGEAAARVAQTVTDRIGADARADQADARLEAGVAEDARDASRDAAKAAHELLDSLRNAASEIQRSRAETLRRLLA